MARSRYYYSDMISNFLVKAKDTIIGELSVASQHDINDETMTTWLEKIGVMKGNLMPYCDHGSAYRVLLTRARLGIIIVVPNGDSNVPPRHNS